MHALALPGGENDDIHELELCQTVRLVCLSLCRELLSLDQGELANAPHPESFGVPGGRQSSLSI